MVGSQLLERKGMGGEGQNGSEGREEVKWNSYC